MHEKSAQCGTVVRSNDSYVPYVFQIYPLPHPTSYLEVPLFKPVHDFCFGTDLALFACPRFTGNETLTPLFLPLGRGDRELFTLNVRNFPQSDALRVEMECASNGKYIAFGHRNGQISLLDLRQSQTTTILQYHNGESFNVLGSAVDLGFLAQRNQLLVKRSFGTCQLHDLRMTTSTGSSMTRSSSSSSSVVHHLGVPSELINPTLSANCNGFAVDPTSEQTLMAPYISAQQEVHLGVWSLGTGVMVGSRRVLAKNTTDDVLYTEVCQRTTPSFSERKKSRKALASSSSTFGVWLKCGRFSKSKSNSRFGSLHHVNFASS